MATILLVESTPSSLALAHKLLRAAHHDVLTAETAEMGMDIARDRLPDLVLLGLGLSDLNACQALAKIRANPATAGWRVVAVTAHAMVGDQRRAIEAGFDGYLSKPIDFATFSRSVEELLP